jgi:hypothetical protein
MEQKKLSALLIFIVPQIIQFIITEYKVNEEMAAEMLYESALYAALEKDETKLWHLSAAALFEMFKEEKETGQITYPEEA